MSQKMRLVLVLSLAFIVSLSAPYATAQKETTGTWTSSISNKGARINLNFDRSTSSGRKNQTGQTYDFSELQNLTREQVDRGGPVKFSLVREAGTIECEGNFENGKGSGTFRFTPNQAFISGMKSRGFDFENDPPTTQPGRLEDRVFTAAVLNVTTAIADDLSSAGFGKLTVGDLFKATIFKVDSAFMREMKASGFPNMGMEELVKARIFKIDAKFVSEATQMGFDKEPFESLVKMKIFKVTTEFIAEVRNEGLNNLSVEELVRLKIFKIDGEFIRKAKAEGVPLTVERMVQKRLGVERDHRRTLLD